MEELNDLLHKLPDVYPDANTQPPHLAYTGFWGAWHVRSGATRFQKPWADGEHVHLFSVKLITLLEKLIMEV